MEFEKQLEQVYSVKQGYIGFLISKYKVTEADAEEIFSNSIFDTLEEIKIEPIKELKYHLFRKFSYHHKLLFGKNRMEAEKIKYKMELGETFHDDEKTESFKIMENFDNTNILNFLPPQYKRLYELRYIKKMKYREIAELEGTSQTTVQDICAKALFRVKTACSILKNGIAVDKVKELKYKAYQRNKTIKKNIHDNKNKIMEYFNTHPKGKKNNHNEIYIDRVFNEHSYDYVMQKHNISKAGVNVIIVSLNRSLRKAGIIADVNVIIDSLNKDIRKSGIMSDYAMPIE